MPTIFPFQQDSLVLQPAKTPLILPLVLTLGMTLAGAWMIRRGAPAGWLAAVLGVAGGALALAHLLLNRTYIGLTPEELTLGTLFGVRRLRWSQIEWCDFNRQGVEIRCLEGRRVRKIAMMSEAYRMQPKELAQLLNQWRVRAARGDH